MCVDASACPLTHTVLALRLSCSNALHPLSSTSVILCQCPSLCFSPASPSFAVVGAAQVKLLASLTNTKDSEELGQILLESTSSIRTVYAFGLQRPMLARFDTALLPLRARALRRSWTAGAGLGSSMAVLFWCYALVFWAGGRFIANGWL